MTIRRLSERTELPVFTNITLSMNERIENMRRNILAILATCIACSSMAEFESLRLAVDAVVTNVSKKTLRVFTEGEIGGQSACKHPSYQGLALIVSNDWQNVIGNIGNIATNQTERYLLLGTGFQYDWSFHLPFFTKVADECLAGNISRAEVAWFEAYSAKPGLVDQLYYRNTEPAVTNLLHKLIRIDGNTNRWMSIMATNAQERVNEYINAGLLYMPE